MNRKEYKKKYNQEHKKENAEYQKRWVEENRERSREIKRNYLKRRRIELKEKVYSHYGKFCNCCGEDNPMFLTVDHVNNDGYKERKGRGGGGTDKTYLRIINENFPDTYQILCYNCNLGKARNGGVCPHVSLDKE